MKLRRWTALLLAASIGLCGERADATRTPLPDPDLDLTSTVITPAAATSAHAWLIESVFPLGRTDDGSHLDLVVLVAPATHTRVLCIVKSPLGLATYEMFHATLPEYGPSIVTEGLKPGRWHGNRWFASPEAAFTGVPKDRALGLTFDIDTDLPVVDVPKNVVADASAHAKEAVSGMKYNRRSRSVWGHHFNDYLNKWISEQKGAHVYRYRPPDLKKGYHYAFNERAWQKASAKYRCAVGRTARARGIANSLRGLRGLGVALSALTATMALDAVAASEHYRFAIEAAKRGDASAVDDALMELALEVSVQAGTDAPLKAWAAYAIQKDAPSFGEVADEYERIRKEKGQSFWGLFIEGWQEVFNMMETD